MPRNLMFLAAFAAALALTPANAIADDADDFDDKVKAFFAGLGDDLEDAADAAEEEGEEGAAFLRRKADEVDDDDDDLRFKAPWDK